MQDLEMYDTMGVVKTRRENKRLMKKLDQCRKTPQLNNQTTFFPPGMFYYSTLEWKDKICSQTKHFLSCFSFLFQIRVPLVGLRMLLNQGCTLKESTLACTSMEPGVEIPDHRQGRRAGIGWWCWLPATATPTMFVDTPAWELSLLGKMSQVKHSCVHYQKKRYFLTITWVAGDSVIQRLLVIFLWSTFQCLWTQYWPQKCNQLSFNQLTISTLLIGNVEIISSNPGTNTIQGPNVVMYGEALYYNCYNRPAVCRFNLTSKSVTSVQLPVGTRWDVLLFY